MKLLAPKRFNARVQATRERDTCRKKYGRWIFLKYLATTSERVPVKNFGNPPFDVLDPLFGVRPRKGAKVPGGLKRISTSKPHKNISEVEIKNI